MVFTGTDYFDTDYIASIGCIDTGDSTGRNINGWKICADFVALDRFCVVVDGSSKLIRSRTSIFAVVFDSA